MTFFSGNLSILVTRMTWSGSSCHAIAANMQLVTKIDFFQKLLFFSWKHSPVLNCTADPACTCIWCAATEPTDETTQLHVRRHWGVYPPHHLAQAAVPGGGICHKSPYLLQTHSSHFLLVHRHSSPFTVAIWIFHPDYKQWRTQLGDQFL
jgi:hypothetical protein